MNQYIFLFFFQRKTKIMSVKKKNKKKNDFR